MKKLIIILLFINTGVNSQNLITFSGEFGTYESKGFELRKEFDIKREVSGLLRKMSFMLQIPKVTVWYCQYGDTRAKPTDIFTNNLYSLFNLDGWKPRPECWNGRKNCHELAPRGSTETGTESLKNNYKFFKIDIKNIRAFRSSSILCN